ncbi:hypothetical protein HWV07_13950 [Natronomonas salina]|uniref:hypothetical protein n=1 Tax=Natronomonas salina TaxID=1710540 RepID=UPI0015B62300|nr:hypothetical protein [Natronomonas salina]QLD90075.1 hypothetical protein HWV07_13950 [Natronomonas salina]
MISCTCGESGFAKNSTFADQAFGTENGSGPNSSHIHDNEGQFQDGELIAREVSCSVATVVNNVPESGP